MYMKGKMQMETTKLFLKLKGKNNKYNDYHRQFKSIRCQHRGRGFT